LTRSSFLIADVHPTRVRLKISDREFVYLLADATGHVFCGLTFELSCPRRRVL
jgi:hypothetical protein